MLCGAGVIADYYEDQWSFFGTVLEDGKPYAGAPHELDSSTPAAAPEFRPQLSGSTAREVILPYRTRCSETSGVAMFSAMWARCSSADSLVRRRIGDSSSPKTTQHAAISRATW